MEYSKINALSYFNRNPSYLCKMLMENLTLPHLVNLPHLAHLPHM